MQCRDLSAYPETAAILRRYENSDSILKGIIDLAFQEGDCFVLVDYKTDTVSSPDVLVDSYREQLMLYCRRTAVHHRNAGQRMLSVQYTFSKKY